MPTATELMNSFPKFLGKFDTEPATAEVGDIYINKWDDLCVYTSGGGITLVEKPTKPVCLCCGQPLNNDHICSRCGSLNLIEEESEFLPF